jgi:antitoxin Phd
MSGRRIKNRLPKSPPDLEVRPVPARFTATQAKSRFDRILETVLRGGTVMITKHDAPKAVLISIGEFNRLSLATQSTLDALRGEFDGMLDRMQTPDARSAMKAAFKASTSDLGMGAFIAESEYRMAIERKKAAAAAKKRA